MSLLLLDYSPLVEAAGDGLTLTIMAPVDAHLGGGAIPPGALSPVAAIATYDVIAGLGLVCAAIAVSLVASRGRPALFRWVAWAFALSLLVCGLDHLVFSLVVTPHGMQSRVVVEAVGATVGIVTTGVLWPLLPRILTRDGGMQRATADLADSIVERNRALGALRTAVAERDRAENLFRQLQKVEALGHVAGGLAHDFNNLLGVILGNLERAARQTPAGTKPANALADALVATDRATSLVKRLMAFARREQIAIETAVVEDSIVALRPIIAGIVPHCAAVFDLDCRWSSHVDLGQFENAVLNLVVNARDAMVDGGTLTIRTRGAGLLDGEDGVRDFVLVEVEDTGTGIPADVAARIFEPFFTTKPLGRGTGLGLSQVADFMRQAGGRTELDSALGKGTRFMLYIPRRMPNVAQETQGLPVTLPARLDIATMPSVVMGSP